MKSCKKPRLDLYIGLTIRLMEWFWTNYVDAEFQVELEGTKKCLHQMPK